VKSRLHVFELEHLAILLDQRVLGLDEDLDERLVIEAADRADHRQAADELRDHAELEQVFGQDLGKELSGILVHLGPHDAVEAHALVADALLDDRLRGTANAPPQMNNTLVVSIWMNS